MENEIVEILNKLDINGGLIIGALISYSDHSYDILYDKEFKELKNEKVTLLEIGVSKGGSILLWNEYFKNSDLVFVDVNDILVDNVVKLINENNYKFYEMDAYTIESFDKISIDTPDGFDIIIDDGPHTLESQILINHYSKLLKSKGKLIIEDIQDYNYCETLINLLPKNEFESTIVDLRPIKNRYDDIMVVVKKLN